MKFEHLDSLPKNERSEYYFQQIQDIWITKGYKSDKRNSLFKAIIRSNIKDLIIVIFKAILVDLFDIGVVVTMREYILYFENKSQANYSIYVMASTLLTLKLLSMLFYRNNNISPAIIGYKGGLELECLIYDKLLKVSGGEFSEGEITNFLQIDSQKLVNFLKNMPTAFVFPFKMGICIYLLFQYFGWTFLFGLITLFLMFGTVVFLMTKYAKYEDILMKASDVRMKITTQTLNSLKILKLYSWDEEFLKRVTINITID